MCGEKEQISIRQNDPKGSPPHVRGKVSSDSAVLTMPGITPACAGKSTTRDIIDNQNQDHPRMCGEKHACPSGRPRAWGSPPHVRGKVRLCIPCPNAEGITPACAGKRLKRSRSIVPHAAIVPLFPSVCNKPAGSDGSPAGHDAPPFLPIENAVPASPAYNLRSL